MKLAMRPRQRPSGAKGDDDVAELEESYSHIGASLENQSECQQHAGKAAVAGHAALIYL